MSVIAGKTAVVTGGTDGIGAATAMELVRRGARVQIVGRSRTKADALLATAQDVPGEGSLEALVDDLSEMAAVREVVERIAESSPAIDLLVHAVGILITRTEHTREGIEKDFAVSYLSRFVFLETAARAGLLHPGTKLLNIATSAPKVPRLMQMEFDDLATVQARVGMRGHGQAQLANDLLTAQAGRRYGITAIGYGPGPVDTAIRREVPGIMRVLLRPFFARSTRQPTEVARELADILADPKLEGSDAYFYDRSGAFPADRFIADPHRQAALLDASLALARKAGIDQLLPVSPPAPPPTRPPRSRQRLLRPSGPH